MAVLRIFSTEDYDQSITTAAQLAAALRSVTHNPSLCCLDFNDQSIQIFYGSPDRYHTEIRHVSAYGVEKLAYPDATQATTAFLTLAANALE